MSDPRAPIEDYDDLPIQPTGSGVADLEMAYEQMKLTEGLELDPSSADDGFGLGSADREDELDSEAHPS